MPRPVWRPLWSPPPGGGRWWPRWSRSGRAIASSCCCASGTAWRRARSRSRSASPPSSRVRGCRAPAAGWSASCAPRWPAKTFLPFRSSRSPDMTATSLLRELRPREDFSPDEAALERILLAPPLPRGRRRSRRALALIGAAGLAAAVIALLPPGSPDVVARAAAALNDPDTILHLKSVDAGGNTMETWQAGGGRQERWV